MSRDNHMLQHTISPERDCFVLQPYVPNKSDNIE